MTNNFKLIALNKTPFAVYFDLPEDELERMNIKRMIVDKFPGFPCRVSLEDAEIGEEVVLLNFEHHAVPSPYRANGPIFIRKKAVTKSFDVNEVPKMFDHRVLSIRGFDKNATMIYADVIQGIDLKATLHHVFINQEIDYLHIHNAKPGCYNCMAVRVMS